MNTNPLAAFTFTLFKRKHLARSEDRDLLARVSIAIEAQDGVTDHREVHENDLGTMLKGAWTLINLDNTFDCEMTARELFRAIDELFATLLPEEPRANIDCPA